MHTFSKSIKEKIFAINSTLDFNEVALEIFRFQSKNNKVYNKYLSLINCNIEDVISIEEIPFLPIQFFKSFSVIIDDQETSKVFKSSGTTLSGRSQHLVSDLSIYENSFIQGFNHLYGNIKDYVVNILRDMGWPDMQCAECCH